MADTYPLLPDQQTIYVRSLARKEEQTEQLIFQFKERLEVSALVRSWYAAIERRPELRTVLRHRGGEHPYHLVLDSIQADYSYRRIQAGSEADWSEGLRQLAEAERRRPFALAKDSLVRLAIAEAASTAGSRFALIWTYHTAMFDLNGISRLIEGFVGLYCSFSEGGDVIAPDLLAEQSHADYVNGLAARINTERSSKYWKELLAGVEHVATVLPEVTSVSAERRPSQDRSKAYQEPLPADVSRQWISLADSCGITADALYVTAWGALLCAYNGLEEIVFGAMTASSVPSIGAVQRIVPVRLSSLQSFEEAARDVHEQLAAASHNGGLTIAELESFLQLGGPLINQVVRVYSRHPQHELSRTWGPECSSCSWTRSSTYAAELTIFMDSTQRAVTAAADDRHELRLELGGASCEVSELERMAGHYRRVIEQLAYNPGARLAEVELLQPAEQALLRSFNDTNVSYDTGLSLHRWFEAEALRGTDRIAIIHERGTMTYGELRTAARELAERLAAAGVTGGDVVGLYMERSPELAVATLAVVMLGAVFVPIVPTLPAARIEAMMTESGVKALCASRRTAATAERLQLSGPLLTVDSEQPSSEGTGWEPPDVNGESPAYVLFTSGSTGKPKGVLVKHRSVVNGLRYVFERFQYSDRDRFIWKAPTTFVTSICELFSAILTGGSLLILPAGRESDLPFLLDTIERNRVTVAEFVPSLLRHLLQELERRPEQIRQLASLRIAYTSGEPLQHQDAEVFRERIYKSVGTKLINTYGMTETSVDVTAYDCTASSSHGLPYTPAGGPIDNVRFYIVNRYDRLLPVGLPGELCISGDALAAGYINAPGEQRFTANPFEPGTRMLRTGDLAAWLPDGTIRIIGRIDRQIKIRGQRVEAGEVERQLAAHPQIRDAAVTAIRAAAGPDMRLAAYYEADRDMTVAELRSFLERVLPEFMIPSVYVRLEQLPVNANGKVDYRALPEPAAAAAYTGAPFEAPATATERSIAAIWSELLALEGGEIGLHDSFFHLGGHSLQVITMLALIKDRLLVDVPLQEVLHTFTVKRVAEVVDAIKGYNRYANKPITLLNKNRDSKLFCFPPLTGYGIIFKEFAAFLDSHALYGFDFVASTARIDMYRNMIVQIQKEGPYRLLGYSAGGNLAFEVAKSLEERGYEVSDLLLLNSQCKIKPIVRTEEQVGRQIERLFEEISRKATEFTANEFVKNVIRKTMLGFLEYESELVNEGTVQAHIHWIGSEAGDGGEDGDGAEGVYVPWKDCSAGAYSEYAGNGAHFDMLQGEAVRGNASLVMSILKKER